MLLSVLIPTCGRPQQLAACLASLRPQCGAEIEVLVGVDGPDSGETDLVGTMPGATCVVMKRGGPGAVRNRLMSLARGRLLLLLNDDVVLHPECVSTHIAAHTEVRDALVLGAAPWKIHEPDTFFDRMIRETSMVFFYDQMHGMARDHDWGFRHAWTLNLSVTRELALREGGFNASLCCPCYEDLEWAWRLGAAVVYRPDARVVHDHRYTPDGYLERERMLGAQALQLNGASPDCAEAIFGRNIGDECDAARDYIEAFDLEDELAWFRDLADQPPAGGIEELARAYTRHRALKKYHWYTGLLTQARRTAA